MIIKNVKFTLFGDYKNIEAQPEKAIKISSDLMLNGVTLLPGTFQQVSPRLGMKAFERMIFNNNQEKLSVEIGIDTIEISKMIVDNKIYNFKSEIDQFIYKVKKIIRVLTESYSELISGRRISLIIETLYGTEHIKPLDEIYKSINDRLPSYDDSETFEWNTRAAKRETFEILGNEEKINLVTEVLRTSGEHTLTGETEEFDTIQARIDVNTVDENTRVRIEDKFVDEFLEKANKLMTSQDTALGVKLYAKD
ncbi:hypothetical protein [Bacillus nitratireducens]|uniref:hypothetical protein n=1 Tax=Bacillus nitratireducens TaxID=2026193 RepID=UPI0011AA8899|nr:hypothetical protein [Bacillus nitratireducens]